jgi:hypothetical protein
MDALPATPDPHPATLSATWVRVEPAPACAAKYAAQLVIQPGGLYSGQAAARGEFTWWDLGTWRVKAPGVLALSVANDEVIDYRFEQRGDRLSITDKDGCRSEYRRTP